MGRFIVNACVHFSGEFGGAESVVSPLALSGALLLCSCFYQGYVKSSPFHSFQSSVEMSYKANVFVLLFTEWYFEVERADVNK